jgi:hypothetical protein
VINKIATEQAEIEVAYALAHALADLGRDAEARVRADRARAPADTLVADVRALTRAQSVRAIARSDPPPGTEAPPAPRRIAPAPAVRRAPDRRA